MNIRYFPGSAKYLSKQQFRTLMCRCKDNVCRANMAIPATPRASYLRVSYRTDMINISVLINSSETSGAAERSQNFLQSQPFNYHRSTPVKLKFLILLFASVNNILKLLEESSRNYIVPTRISSQTYLQYFQVVFVNFEKYKQCRYVITNNKDINVIKLVKVLVIQCQ